MHTTYLSSLHGTSEFGIHYYYTHWLECYWFPINIKKLYYFLCDEYHCCSIGILILRNVLTKNASIYPTNFPVFFL